MAQIESVGPIKVAMKLRRDAIALAAEALSKMFDKGEEDLVSQVTKYHRFYRLEIRTFMIYFILEQIILK